MFDPAQIVARSPASAWIIGVAAALLAVATPVTPSRAQQPGSSAETTVSEPAEKAPAPSPTHANIKDAAQAARRPVSDCAGGEAFRKLANTANSSAIIYNANLVPAGNVVDFGLTRSLDSSAHYFALFLDDKTAPRDDSRHGARARTAGETDDLVAKHLLPAGDTIVSVDVPTDAAGFWTKRNLYIYQCDSTRRPFNVSYLPVHVSPIEWSIPFTVLIVIAVYYLASKAFTRLSNLSLGGVQAWNPIRITAGSDSRGSLSAFQVFFFTILVFAMVAFVLLRTGVLSDLSTTVLELLGISGVGAAAAKGADSSKTGIDPTNNAWLMNKGWYDKASVRANANPSFYDLISSDGNFDVYRFQSLLFTAAVGLALFIGGVSQLASFTVPQNILGILGLSQVVYIAGKLVSSGNAGQLNAVVTDLRNAESDLRDAVHTTPTSSGTPAGAVPAPNHAVNRATAVYLEKAKGAARLFTDVTGRPIDPAKLQPSVGTA
jgi:hypothetical protein